MNPRGSMTRISSAFRWCKTHRHECSAGGALLTCLAVVLNVHAVIKSPEPQMTHEVAEPAVASSSIIDHPPIETAQAREDAQSDESAQELAGAEQTADVERPADVEQLADAERPADTTQLASAIQVAEQMNPLDDLLPAPADPFVRKVFMPVTPAAEAEPQAATARQETPDPTPLATIAGVWVPDASTCSARTLRDGLLPTIINPEGAWAGETFCTFKNARQTETGWRVAANCSNSTEHWTTDVRLSLKDDRLTWSSRRGTQIYSRCAADFMTASLR